jgi:curved DNA-binding protein CbpA
VTTPRDDHYDVIGVDPGAPTDEIRQRYRARRSELDAKGTDEAREESARLNRAWNVLSDPYQRGRYDAQREAGDETEYVDADDVEVVDAAARPRRRRMFEPPPRRDAPAAPAIEYPGGHRPPENRRRVLAMVIDLFVLFMLFAVASSVVLPAIIKEQYPVQFDRVERIRDEIDDLDQQKDDLNKQADDARGEEKTRLENEADAKQEEIDKLDDEAVDIQKDFVGTYILVIAGFVLVALAYLVVPSALTGQTLGKRLQKIRALRADGSPLGWKGALVRFAPLAVITGLALTNPSLGQIVFIAALFAVLSWMRNVNRQGMHDRLAKTIVVDAS